MILDIFICENFMTTDREVLKVVIMEGKEGRLWSVKLFLNIKLGFVWNDFKLKKVF